MVFEVTKKKKRNRWLNPADDMTKGGHMDRFGSILAELSVLLDLEAPLQFEDGACSFHFEGVAINLQLDSLNDRIVTSAYISIWPQHAAPALSDMVLTANLYWQAGGTVCLEPGTRSLLLLSQESVDGLCAQTLLLRLRRFVANAQELRQKVSDFLARPSPTVGKGVLAVV